MTQLELRELRKTYRSRGRPAVDAVRGLDLALRSGELLGLPGPSGCGKSTTLRMIAGLEAVTGGDILIGLKARRRSARGDVSRRVADLAERVGLTEKDGVIQQLGTPYEIYDSPANVFVADFVGEPAINLLKGVATDEGLPTRVVAHEPLLESGIATPTLEGGVELVVLTDPEVRPAHGDEVRVVTDPDLTHVFDAETGDTLR